MNRPLISALALALIPAAAGAALPGEIARPVTIVVPAMSPSVSAAAVGARLNLAAAAPSLSLPSAPRPIPVILPVSLPSIAPQRAAVDFHASAHELDWSFLGGDAAESLVSASPAPRPRSPSLAAARADVAQAAEHVLVSSDAFFDGARRVFAAVDW